VQHEDVARVAAAAADRLADESARGTDLRQSDIDISSVNMSSKSLIACAPTESLGWLGVYWSLEGFGPRAATFLGQSYRFARHEAWIQFIRAPLALRGFSALPSALNDYAAQDFEDVFRARLFPSAAMLYQTASAKPGHSYSTEPALRRKPNG
jgi:hypothetical protein